MDLSKLHAEFPREAVHWRVQGKPYERNGKYSAMALAYIDARDVMDRLDSVCGPENWQAEYVETPQGRVICRLGVKVCAEWVWKSDGAGKTAVEGEKGGISDALKRAAVAWGVGRYLYRLDSPWVGCEVKRNNPSAWHRWTEDPWSKVKAHPFVPPIEPAEEADAPEPAPNHAATRDRIKKGFATAKTLPILNERSQTEAATIGTLPEPMRNELRAAYTARKAALTPQDEGAMDPAYQ